MDFQEALSHCRWTTVLKQFLQEEFEYEGKTFEYVFADIHRRCQRYRGLGILTVYDVTSAICKFHGIPIDRVYIIGGGPKRGVQLLNLPLKMQKIDTIYLEYVDTKDVLDAFEKKSIHLDIHGDALESYLCNWQKSKHAMQLRF